MLDRFKRQKDGIEVMSDKELLSHAASNIFAGSDTTAISLRSMFYYFCKNPQAYQKLVIEIDEMDAEGKLSDPITFAESNQMPYLQASMKEAMRMHPAVGLLLERVVPEGGTTIAGTYPGGDHRWCKPLGGSSRQKKSTAPTQITSGLSAGSKSNLRD